MIAIPVRFPLLLIENHLTADRRMIALGGLGVTDGSIPLLLGTDTGPELIGEVTRVVRYPGHWSGYDRGTRVWAGWGRVTEMSWDEVSRLSHLSFPEIDLSGDPSGADMLVETQHLPGRWWSRKPGPEISVISQAWLRAVTLGRRPAFRQARWEVDQHPELPTIP